MVHTTIEKLFGSSEIYRVIVDSAEEGIWIADKDGVITYVNKKLIDLLGYDEDQLIGKKMFDFADDKNRVIMKKSLEESLKGKRDTYSFSVRDKLGMSIPMMVATTPMQDAKGEFIGTVELMSDMTYQKKVENELRDREEHLKMAQELAHLGSWVWDIPNNKEVWSDERYKIFGLSPREIEPTMELYLDFVYPEDRASLKNALFTAIQEKKRFIMDYRIVRKDGAIRYMHSEGHITYNDKGEPVKLFAIGQDITERVQNEVSLKESKAQADLYVELMGHDINNLNQTAMGFLELALEKLEADKKLGLDSKLLIEKPLKALDNSSKLIDNVRMLQQLMTYGVKIVPTDLCSLIKNIDVQSFMIEGRNITVNIHALPHCMVEANELLRDVITNLISNAIKHSEEGKPVIIDVKIEPVKEKGQLFYKCMVEDNGPGIPDEMKAKLFHRFQRGATKAHGKGLGLYLVRTLVEGYHGKVWVEDRIKGDHTKGSRFVVLLHSMGDLNNS